MNILITSQLDLVILTHFRFIDLVDHLLLKADAT